MEKEQEEVVCHVVKTQRLQFFPIMMFAVVMGFSGLSIVYQKAHEILGLGKLVGDVFAWLDLCLFALILVAYGSKMVLHLDEVKKEFEHPVRINFFATSAISFLLISIVFHDISGFIAWYGFVVGTVLQTFFTFYTMSFWIRRNVDIAHSNPAWLIPIVGNVLVPVAGAGMVDNELLVYFFSIGVFFWVVLSAILINRIIFHHQLAGKFIPTLFIFIAPPAISFVAYVKMYAVVDLFAHFLYSMALFFSFLLFFMYKSFMKLKFFISWWAFTFPLAAISIASMLAYKKLQIPMYSYYSYFFMAITTLVVLLVAIKTVGHMLKREICIQE